MHFNFHTKFCFFFTMMVVVGIFTLDGMGHFELDLTSFLFHRYVTVVSTVYCLIIYIVGGSCFVFPPRK